MKRFLLAAFLLAARSYAQIETTPPPPAEPRPVGVPQTLEQTLPNGLRVIVIPKHNVPLVVARLIVKTGAASDPKDRGGLAELTASLLTKGTLKRSAREIAEGVESLGASIDSGAGWDASYVSTSAMTSKFPQALGFVSDVVRRPRFAPEELKRLREQDLDDLQVAMHEPRALRNMVTARVVFGSAPYGHSIGGTPESLERITRGDVVTFHRRYYHPANAILVIGGDIDAPKAFALAKTWFVEWTASTLAGLTPPRAAASTGEKQVVVIDMPDAGQAAVAVARLGIARGDAADYPASEVANMVLGGDYSSRLNQEVRIKRGLSYGAYSGFDARRDRGPFIASALTKNESAPEVASLLLDQIQRMTAEPVGADELKARKANLIGSFSRSLETSGALVARIGDLALYGLPLDEVRAYPREIESIDAAKVAAFAGAHFAGSANVIIVGDAKKFADDLKKRFPNATVIPLDKLDLNRPTLRK